MESTSIKITRQQYNALFLCKAKNDVRYYLEGIHLNYDESRLESTNSHALVTVTASFENTGDNHTNIIFTPLKKAPKRALTVNIYYHSDNDNQILVEFYDKNGLKFEYNPCQIIDGTFPDCNRVAIKPEQQTTPTEHFGVNPKLFAPICNEFEGPIFGFKFYEEKMVCDLDDNTRLIVMLARI